MSFMKSFLLTALLIASMLYLSGCLVMMPLMMGNMFKKDTDNSMQPETELTISGLRQEGVADLEANTTKITSTKGD